MRKLTILFVCMFFLFTSMAFGENNTNLSPALNWVHSHVIKSGHAFSPLAKNYSIFAHPKTGETTYGVILKLKDVADASKLENLGVEIHTVLPSGIVTAWLPERAVEVISTMTEVEYVHLSAKNKLKMDVSRLEIGIDRVHAGDGLDHPYKGEGVIVGVIDSGLDLDHADFQNEDGTTRVISVWDQTAEGTPPQDYSYGNECTAAQINAGTCPETDDHGHGTHVAGTAAGNGRSPNGTGDFTGLAPEADLIIVKMTGDDNQIIDGAAYIFSRADALGRPAVINMSLGSHSGPHDGSSLYDQGLDELTGPGKILVAAAGNEGEMLIHLGYEVDHNGSYSLFNPPNPDNDQVVFEVWYAADYSIDVKIAQVDGSFTTIQETDWVTPGQLFETTFNSGQNVGIDATDITNSQNGDRHIMMGILGANIANSYWALGFRAHDPGQTARFDCWPQSEQFGDFVSDRPGYVNADVLETVGSPGVANNIITVGAYNTKNQWIDMNGQNQSGDFTIGDRAGFSSIGPTRDQRLKPEICAPGNLIASALTNDIPIENEARVIQGGYYQLMEGTSMATPHITGVVALMLQRDPTLDYAQALSVLTETIRTDDYTSSNGDLPNVFWGHGKVDGYEAVSNVTVGIIPDSDGLAREYSLKQNYPNPFNPMTTISFDVPLMSDVSLSVYDVLGRFVKTLLSNKSYPKGSYSLEWDGTDHNGQEVQSGVYLYHLKTNGNVETRRMILLK